MLKGLSHVIKQRQIIQLESSANIPFGLTRSLGLSLQSMYCIVTCPKFPSLSLLGSTNIPAIFYSICICTRAVQDWDYGYSSRAMLKGSETSIFGLKQFCFQIVDPLLIYNMLSVTFWVLRKLKAPA
jgi:hypothetical protein